MAAATSVSSNWGTFNLLYRNPAGCCVILISGLLVAVTHVPTPLVVANLSATVWGEDMSRNMGILDMLRYVLAFLCTGPLGRFGDRYGSQAAMIFVAVVQTLPPLMLLLFGETEMGLTAWSVTRVATGVTGTAVTVAPALYALLHDVVPAEDLDAFTAIVFSAASLLWLVNLLIAAVLQKGQGTSTAVLLYVLGLSAVMMGMIAIIRVPKRETKTSGCPELGRSSQQCSDPESAQGMSGSGSPGQDEAEHVSTTSSSNISISYDGEKGASKRKCEVLASLRFALSDKALFKLCAIAALVSIPETVLFEVMSQFSFDNLDMMDVSTSGNERSLVTFRNVLAIQLSLVFGSYVVSLLVARLTSLRLLRWLIPACAVLQSLPALVRIVPYEHTVVLSAVSLGLSLLVLPPLQALVPQFAPEGRVGEAVGTVGSFKCIASLLGNGVVAAGVPLIQSTGLEKPLWVLFPLCGLVSLCGLPLALRLPAPPAAAREAAAAEPRKPEEPKEPPEEPKEPTAAEHREIECAI